MLQFYPEDLPPYIRVKKNPRARRLALRLDVKDRVFQLVVPRGISLKKAQAFAEDHDRWMREKLLDLPKPIPFKNGARIPVLGRYRTIKIVSCETLKGTAIELTDRKIIIKTNLADPSEKLKRFLKELAQKELSAMAHKKAKKIRKKIKSVHVRDTKSRWGSCSEDGSISFSWRLIFAPYEAMDYVVAHEVAHLKHLDHSTRFWSVCRELSKDFIEGQYWMRNFGQDLMLYGQRN